jgi:hypothetical protein
MRSVRHVTDMLSWLLRGG